MQDMKLTRRVIGFLMARLGELDLGVVNDPRRAQGKTWSKEGLLATILAGMMAGKKGFGELEELTTQMPAVVRRKLKIRGRLPDSTARDFAVALSPDDVGQLLSQVGQLAYRRKALVEDFPISVVAMDGKSTTAKELDNCWAQTHRSADKLTAYGLIRAINCALVSCSLRPIIETIPMGASGNEVGFFATAFNQLLARHNAAFEMITYDAGANSARNAALVVAAGKHYTLALKDTNRFLLKRAKEVLAHKPPATAVAQTSDLENKDENIRTLRSLHLAEVPTGYKAIKSVRTVLRVQSQRVNAAGNVITEEERYFISSLPHDRLSYDNWLDLVRRHWGVETAHNILDVAFQEDDRPWVTHSAQGMLVLMLLRRIAYTLLALWRGRTLRTDENHLTPWKTLFAWVSRALEQATQATLEGLRSRKAIPAFS